MAVKSHFNLFFLSFHHCFIFAKKFFSAHTKLNEHPNTSNTNQCVQNSNENSNAKNPAQEVPRKHTDCEPVKSTQNQNAKCNNICNNHKLSPLLIVSALLEILCIKSMKKYEIKSIKIPKK